MRHRKVRGSKACSHIDEIKAILQVLTYADTWQKDWTNDVQ